MRAVLAQVASAPPKRFAGSGYWEAMKGNMTGWFEVRVDGPRRHHSDAGHFAVPDWDVLRGGRDLIAPLSRFISPSSMHMVVFLATS